jgi:hypothetical protein
MSRRPFAPKSWQADRKKQSPLVGTGGLCYLVAMQGFEPRTLRI